MRQAKYMVSKYNGQCNDCGRPIAAGENIYWKARGVVQCSDCMPSNDNAPASDTMPNSAAGSWSNALAWNSAPAPGASIGAAATQPATPAPNYPPEHINSKLADINTRLQAENTPDPAPAPTFTVVSSTPDPDPAPEVVETPSQTLHAPADDLAIAMLQDQLISLVNAIGKLTPDQISTLRDYTTQLQATSDYTRKHCFIKLAELFGA